jgi:hypothetical protein
MERKLLEDEKKVAAEKASKERWTELDCTV